MVIGSFMSAEHIALDLIARGKRSVISKIAMRIASQSGISEQVIRESLFDRERLGTTGVGHGVAIPHALLDAIICPIAFFARLKRPVEFNAPDDVAVELVFTLLWPKRDDVNFLPFLAKVSRLFRSSRRRDWLLRAQSPDEVLKIIQDDSQQMLPDFTFPPTFVAESGGYRHA